MTMSVLVQHLSIFLRQRRAARSRCCAGAERGIGLVEPMITLVIIALAIAVGANLFSITTQSRIKANQRSALIASIDANLAAIRDQALRLTCCSGRCTIGIPSGITPGTTSVCATANRIDDRYFFPQRDNVATTSNFPGTTEAREPYAVDQLCASDSNLVVTPLRDAINAATSAALVAPVGSIRTLTVIAGNVLQVSYSDAATGAVIRVERIIPPMVAHCS